ncbi:hypothetical protein CYY_007956 [Polysphondylium violaceum]|uniref:Uncharacterized protein n=1 Tax=Polysphondylium violaceum TaxID=133409 RepID=A0A8J4UQI4_9MYCE|nr:hypothetical protein CYY_007956 [Polysphondylium violaceum]
MCRSDVLLTGFDGEVDWWYITKVRGFGDTYLYIDSKTSEEKFKVGYYLRSQYSAFGATLLPFTGAYKDQTKSFVAFGEYSTSHNANKEFSKFYEQGAHQKGIFGWTEVGNSQWKGFYIEHSLPYFPQLFQQGKTFMNPPINFDPRIITANLDQKQIYRVSLYFSYYGWRHPFFYRNLMPMSSSGCVKINLLDNGQIKPHYEYRDKQVPIDQKESAKEKILRTTSTYTGAIIEIVDINPFSVVHTHRSKPSQHIFCVSIDTKARFIDFMSQYKYVSNQGIVSNVHQVRSSSLNDVKPYFSFYDANDKLIHPGVSLDRATQAEFITKKITFNNNITAETMINFNQGTTGIGNDIWYGLIKNGEGSSRVNPYLEAGKQVYISTWSFSDRKAWWRSNGMNARVLEPTFQVQVYGSTIKWKSNCQNDHSKIAYTKEKDHNVWNVCVGGGNLYTTDKSKKDNSVIKSSILLCLKLDNLRGALESITEDTWDGSKGEDKTEFDNYTKAYKVFKNKVLKMEDGDYISDFIEDYNPNAPIPTGYSDLLGEEFSRSSASAEKLCQALLNIPIKTKFTVTKVRNNRNMVNIRTDLFDRKIMFEYRYSEPLEPTQNLNDDPNRLVQLENLIPLKAATEYNKQLNIEDNSKKRKI